MIRRPPRSTRTDTPFPTRRSSDLTVYRATLSLDTPRVARHSGRTDRAYDSALCIFRPFMASAARSEEHTSELQSLMRISYAVFCLKKKKDHINTVYNIAQHTNQRKDTQTTKNTRTKLKTSK